MAERGSAGRAGLSQVEQAASKKAQGVSSSDCFELADVAFASSHKTTSKVGDPQPLLGYCLLPLERDGRQTWSGSVALREYYSVQPTRCSLQAPNHIDVVAYAGAGGIQHGISSCTPTFVTLKGATSTQELWSVRFDRELVEGNCGSIVVGELSGELLGHIVAGSPSTGVALVVPAYLVLNDIKQRWDPGAALADDEARTALSTHRSQSTIISNHTDHTAVAVLICSALSLVFLPVIVPLVLLRHTGYARLTMLGVLVAVAVFLYAAGLQIEFTDAPKRGTDEAVQPAKDADEAAQSEKAHWTLTINTEQRDFFLTFRGKIK